MAIPFRVVALVYRLAAVAVIATGIVRLLDLFTADPSWITMLYFTAQSNVLALVWMAIVAIWTARDLRADGPRGTTNPSARIHGAVMMAVTVTMLVYTVVLVPSLTTDSSYVPYTLTDSLVHVVTPILVVFDWLLFTAKGRMRWFDPLLWALIPLLYLVFAFIYSALGGEFAPGVRYPYPFMNVEVLGVGGVALWLVALTVALEIVGFAYVAIDRALGRAALRAPGVSNGRERTAVDPLLTQIPPQRG